MAIAIGASGAATAHANYARSDPPPDAELTAPPARVVVGFSERYAPASSALTVIDQNGGEIASGGQPTGDPTELALPVPPVPDGVYTVAWHTVSAEDGHDAKGYFVFRVGSVAFIPAPPATQTKTQGDVTASLAVSPAAPGKNGYVVAVRRGDAPLPNVTRVRLRITPLARDIGQSEIVLTTMSQPGQYGGSGYELPFAGRYRIQVQVRRSDTVDDLAFDFETAVAIPTASPSATPSPSVAQESPAATVLASASPSVAGAPAGPALSATAVALGVLALLTLVVILMRRRP